jgi:hypothetical protein
MLLRRANMKVKYTKDRPFRQDDPRWANEIMWNRKLVMECYNQYIKDSDDEAQELLRDLDNKGGNTIGNEGCLITCLAMVLHMLDGEKWNPKKLHEKATELLYYSQCGLSMATLYADLVSEVSNGEVQLCIKEEYLSGETGWEPTFATESIPLRAYFRLPEKERKHFIAMLKIGTYDDTIASHYVLVDPEVPINLQNGRDVAILDPAMPLYTVNTPNPWRLSDSMKQIRKDKKIRGELDRKKIQLLQICGVWLFARWKSEDQDSLLTPLFDAR